MVEHTRRCVAVPFSDTDGNVGIAPDVLDPPRRFTRFGKQVETLAPNHEPNLDLAQQTRPAPDRGQVKDVLAPTEPFMEGWVVLSALAAVTNRIRLATLATSVAYRNPAHLAKIAAGVDHISGGRMTLGIGDEPRRAWATTQKGVQILLAPGVVDNEQEAPVAKRLAKLRGGSVDCVEPPGSPVIILMRSETRPSRLSARSPSSTRRIPSKYASWMSRSWHNALASTVLP
jgi:hypothetical protein